MRRSVSQGRGFLKPHRGRRPVPIDWADYDVKARHDKMVELVENRSSLVRRTRTSRSPVTQWAIPDAVRTGNRRRGAGPVSRESYNVTELRVSNGPTLTLPLEGEGIEGRDRVLHCLCEGQ